MSQEYIGAIILLVVGGLKAFGIEIPIDALQGIVTGAIALYIAVRRYKRGDIDVLGRRS